MRKLVVEGSEYKVVHQELLCDLLLLSTSTYSQVKKKKKKKKMKPHTHTHSHTRQINKENSIRTSVGSHLPDAININISGENRKLIQSVCMCIWLYVFAQVRSRAQTVLTAALGTYSFSYRDLIPRILQLLSPQDTARTQQFKVVRTHTHTHTYRSVACGDERVRS